MQHNPEEEEMKKSQLLTVILVLLVGSVLGCSKSGSTSTSNVEIQPAPINEVRIDFLPTEPLQVSVYIKIGLRDTCTKFHDLTTEQSGNTITIHVTTERPKDAICGQIYTFFETNANLGSKFTSGETYTVHVNDQTTTFTMP